VRGSLTHDSAVSAAPDFNRGTESFTTATLGQVGARTQVDSVSHYLTQGGEKTNGSGDAIASNFRRDGTSQHSGLGPRQTP